MINLKECSNCGEEDILIQTEDDLSVCQGCFKKEFCQSCACTLNVNGRCIECEGNPGCGSCSGSGEGMYDGSTCNSCKGSGEDRVDDDEDDGRADYEYDRYRDERDEE